MTPLDIAADISATRYVSVAGYAVLVYDTVLTFSDEVEYTWSSKNNFAKWALLVNKYLVLAILTLVNMELSGLTGISWTDSFCQSWLASHAMLSVISIALSNGLVLLRVKALWEHRSFITKILFSILFSTTVGSLVILALLLSQFIPEISYSPVFLFCGINPLTNAHLLSMPWGIPLIFDFTASMMTIWNALDRPRDMNTKFTDALRQDGLFYFIALAFLRLLNVVVISVAPTALIFSTAYFTWAIVTTVMGRFSLRMRQSETSLDSDEENGAADSYEIPLRLSTPKNSFDSYYSRSSSYSAYSSQTHKRPDFFDF